jgi:hypothetical protein
LAPTRGALDAEVQSAGETKGDILNPTGYFSRSGAAELDRLRLQAQIPEEMQFIRRVDALSWAIG